MLLLFLFYGLFFFKIVSCLIFTSNTFLNIFIDILIVPYGSILVLFDFNIFVSIILFFSSMLFIIIFWHFFVKLES